MLTLPSPPCHYHQSAHRPLSTLQKTCHPYPFTLHNPPITQRPPKAIHPPPIYQTFNSINIIIHKTTRLSTIIHPFIHSFIQAILYRLFRSTATHIRSRHSTGTVSEFHAEAPQATTTSEGLAQSPYVAARAGFEPAS